MPAPHNFQTVPDQTAIERLPRDLRFHPVANPNPQMLSSAQLEAFNRDGYLKCIRIFTESESRENRRYFDALLARVLAEGGTSYSISTAHLKYGRVYDLLTNPRIVTCIRDCWVRTSSPGARIFSARCRTTANASPGTRMPATGR